MPYVFAWVYAISTQLVAEGSSVGERRVVGAAMFGVVMMPAVFALLQVGRRLHSGVWPAAETTGILGRTVPGQVSVLALAVAMLVAFGYFLPRHDSAMSQFQSMKIPAGRLARMAIAFALVAFVIGMLLLNRFDPRAALAGYVATGTLLYWFLRYSGLKARWAGEPADSGNS